VFGNQHKIILVYLVPGRLVGAGRLFWGGSSSSSSPSRGRVLVVRRSPLCTAWPWRRSRRWRTRHLRELCRSYHTRVTPVCLRPS